MLQKSRVHARPLCRVLPPMRCSSGCGGRLSSTVMNLGAHTRLYLQTVPTRTFASSTQLGPATVARGNITYMRKFCARDCTSCQPANDHSVPHNHANYVNEYWKKYRSLHPEIGNSYHGETTPVGSRNTGGRVREGG
ncbi:uncharacterized protein LOC121870596 [Homarus americanus]|uniref:uncharacterized protein LOC121870596 n=1 Tax=Homarus americanus TaxID=6706 RepID=UPI001C4564F3|nr:uncharacterized protein LOC121870596 [Homarus americanus]